MAIYSKARVVKTVRATIRDRDSLMTTRPTVSRGVTMPLTANAKSPFNDCATIVFNTASANVQYPFGLKQGDINLVGDNQVVSASTPGLGFPNRGGGLVAPGNVAKNAIDDYVADIPGSLSSYRSSAAYGPFVEQNLHAVESASLDDPFYQTGSRPSDVGLGLSQPLWSKTRVEIDLTPTVAKTFGYTQQATSSNQQPKYTPMVYYNFGTKTWDVVGRPAVAAGFRSDTDIPTWLGEAPVGFTRGAQLLITGANLACLPCSNFGFPVHPKFHARPDYTLNMSGVIDRPFLLEKFTYEFDASYTTGSTSERFDRLFGTDAGTQTFTSHAASIMTFFMMNQRLPASASVVFDTPAHASSGLNVTYQVTASLPADVSLSGSDASSRVDTVRDLITFAQVVSHSGSVSLGGAGYAGTTMDRILREGLGRELNVDVAREGNNSSMARRVLALSGTAKQTLRLERQFGWRLVGDTKVQFQQDFGFLSGSNVPGGRNNIEMGMTGRDWVASQPAGVLGSKAITDIGGAVIYPSPSANTIISPYLLLPTDRLVFGWQAPHLLDGQIVSASQASALQGLGPQMTLFPGKGKLTLYGSMLRDSVEFHDTLRQPLVSDAVNEALHHDNPVTDQFDTEPYYLLSGSQIDNLVSGAMRNSNAARGVFANNANPGAPPITLGTTFNERLISVNELKSTFRHVTHVCPSELFFDCLLPNPAGIAHINNAATLFLDLGGKETSLIILDIGRRFGDNAQEVNGDDSWSMTYPYEPRYSSLKRELSPFSSIACDKILVGTGSEPMSNKNVGHFVAARPMLNAAGVYRIHIVIDSDPNTGAVFPLSDAEARKQYYGIGDLNTFVSSSINTTGSHNIPDVRFKTGSQNVGFGTNIRGWRYGIKNGVHEYTRAVFRRDRFGQHRDMLEQRIDGKFYAISVPNIDVADKHTLMTGETAGAVQVNFVTTDGSLTEPNQTVSSNLSHEATSSLPCFDGTVKNREDPLDLSLLNSSPAIV